jgi:hypothetical protein
LIELFLDKLSLIFESIKFVILSLFNKYKYNKNYLISVTFPAGWANPSSDIKIKVDKRRNFFIVI